MQAQGGAQLGAQPPHVLVPQPPQVLFPQVEQGLGPQAGLHEDWQLPHDLQPPHFGLQAGLQAGWHDSQRGLHVLHFGWQAGLHGSQDDLQLPHFGSQAGLQELQADLHLPQLWQSPLQAAVGRNAISSAKTMTVRIVSSVGESP